MGFASIFHPYVDGVDVGHRVAIIGPGPDHEDIDYFMGRNTNVTIIGPGETYHPAGAERWPFLVEELIVGGDEARGFDTIWATHVLEHSLNPGIFLDQCLRLLNPGGSLFVSVPPAKHEIVGGHVSLWNMGLLWYRLILAGFDVALGKYSTMGYNLFAHVRKPVVPIQLPPLVYDNPDIESLQEADLWPRGFVAHQGFNGNISIGEVT